MKILFDTKEELQQAVDQYFAECEEQEKPCTVTGLAAALKTSRQTLINYQNREEYAEVINDAKRRIEAFAEEQLFTGRALAGVIFSLKNNYGWTDRQQVEYSGPNGGPINVKAEPDYSKLTVEELKQLEEIATKALPGA